MRVLVIGAGASIEEAKRANIPEEFWPPTIANFAKKMWDGPVFQFFNYWLPDYLKEHGIDPGNDPTSAFIELQKDPERLINLERLFEYCWVNRGKQFKDDWENLIHHGILNPLSFLLNKAFYENGVGVKQLEAGKLVSGRLKDGDLALNLNYDPMFEITAIQQGQKLTYVPNEVSRNSILIAKPHGSFNLLADERSFWFAHPDCIGAVPTGADNFRNHRAIVPPRFNKQYAQHPIARIIINGIANLHPDMLTFWGVGLTDSDTDLLDVYRKWIDSASVIEVINPDATVTERAMGMFKKDVRHYSTLEEWLG
jgi:hypothetical protein